MGNIDVMRMRKLKGGRAGLSVDEPAAALEEAKADHNSPPVESPEDSTVFGWWADSSADQQGPGDGKNARTDDDWWPVL